jgi:hypothetical protein
MVARHNFVGGAMPFWFVDLWGTNHFFDISKHRVFVRDDRYFVASHEFYGPHFYDLLSSNREISAGRAQVIARRYALTHFPRSQRLNGVIPMPIRQVDVDTHHRVGVYDFWFYEDPGGISVSPCRCYVVVEGLTGRVVNYWGFDYPITTSPKPTIKLNDAIKTAMNSVLSNGKNPSLKALGISDFYPTGKERLVYEIKFSGVGPSEWIYPSADDVQILFVDLNKQLPWWTKAPYYDQNNYLGAVDAHTGEFLGWNFEIIPPPKPGELR